MIENRLKRWIDAKPTIWAIVALGTLFRIVQYFNNRSLWVDEAKLSINIVERGFIELLQPLDYGQSAAPGFLFLQKLSTSIVGNDEFGLRLIPLLSQLLSFYLLYSVGQQLISKRAVSLTLAFFAASYSILYFATEAKQYSTDILVALLVLKLICWLRGAVLRPSTLALASVAVSLLIWFSFPAAFVLAGVGTVLLIITWRQHKPRQATLMLIPSVCWALSFLGLVYVVLNNTSNMGDLQASWGGRGSFMPFPPTSLTDLGWFVDTFFQFLEDPFYLPYFISPAARLGSFLLMVGLLLGSISLVMRRPVSFFLLISPIVVTLLASGLEQYPFKGRLILFLTPFFVFLFAEGIVVLSQFPLKGRFQNSLLVIFSGFILFQPYLTATKGLVRPVYRHEMRPLMAYLQTHYQPDEHLYLYERSAEQFVFYSNQFGFSEDDYTMGRDVREFSTEVPYQPDLDAVARQGKVWFVFANMHIPSEVKAVEAYLDTIGQQLDSHQEPGAIAMLYQFPKPYPPED
ncbi:MAG: glycosyltransferase family 39 protein [Cyanobacteria bacterium P01_A01_bin.15]